MEKEPNPVYVVTMAIYSENDGYLHTEAVGVFAKKETAEYELEGAIQNYLLSVCDARGVELMDVDPEDTNGEVIVDFSSVNGEKAAFRIDIIYICN